MITTATQEQWDRIEQLRLDIMESQTRDISREEVLSAVAAIWNRMDKPMPLVLVFDSPLSSAIVFGAIKTVLGGSQLRIQLDSQLRIQLYSQLGSQLYSQLYSQLGSQLYSQLDSQLDRQLDSQLRRQLRSQLDNQLRSQLYSQLYSQLDSQLDSQLYSQLCRQLRSQLGSQLDSQLRSQLGSKLDSQLDSQQYWSVWWRAWEGWYLGGEILGVKYKQGELRDFVAWCEAVPYVAGSLSCLCVSRNPISIGWQDGVLHNESGPAVKYADGWCHYAINGIALDEQIVMRPETQTIEQIDKEGNADVLSIRIERFGWPNYLKQSGASVVDESKNFVSGCPEALYQTKNGEKRLVAVCPTGRVFAMGVPAEIETCEQAQRWLGPAQGNCIAAT